MTSAEIVGSGVLSPKPSLGVVIHGCSNSGAITGKEHVGGIAAMLDSIYGGMGADGRELASITDCHNTGNISAGGDYVGGIVGLNTYYDALTLNSSSNSGDVHGVNFVGGIAGYVDHNHDNMVENVSSSGNVFASGSYIGGLLGYGALRDSSWQGQFISVAADSRFVSELVGDYRSVVMNSTYQYRPLEGFSSGALTAPVVDGGGRFVWGADAVFDPMQVETVTPENGRQQIAQTAGVRSRDPLEDGQPAAPDQEETGKPTVFEVVRTAMADNPLISLAYGGLVLILIVLGGYRRYRKVYRER